MIGQPLSALQGCCCLFFLVDLGYLVVLKGACNDKDTQIVYRTFYVPFLATTSDPHELQFTQCQAYAGKPLSSRSGYFHGEWQKVWICFLCLGFLDTTIYNPNPKYSRASASLLGNNQSVHMHGLVSGHIFTKCSVCFCVMYE